MSKRGPSKQFEVTMTDRLGIFAASILGSSANAPTGSSSRSAPAALILMLSQVSFVGRDQSDTDRIEPVQSIEDLRFSARKHRGIVVRWDCPLLASTPPLHNSTVDARRHARSLLRPRGARP